MFVCPVCTTQPEPSMDALKTGYWLMCKCQRLTYKHKRPIDGRPDAHDVGYRVEYQGTWTFAEGPEIGSRGIALTFNGQGHILSGCWEEHVVENFIKQVVVKSVMSM